MHAKNPMPKHDVNTWRGYSGSPDQTEAWGVAVGRLARAGDTIALIGELGAGKTRLTRGVARGLGVDVAQVSSPTFVLVGQYPHLHGGPDLLHVDAYRLAGWGDLESIGWGQDLFDNAVVIVEWADRIADHLSDDRLEVWLTHSQERDTRELLMTAHGAWRSRMAGLRQALDTANIEHKESAVKANAMTTHPGGKSKASGPPRCPICKKSTKPDSPEFPFCCGRCKTIDLGKWVKGDYVISRSIEQADLDEE